MTDIPEDVMKAAREATDKWSNGRQSIATWGLLDDIIARAILADRRRPLKRLAPVTLIIESDADLL